MIGHSTRRLQMTGTIEREPNTSWCATLQLLQWKVMWQERSTCRGGCCQVTFADAQSMFWSANTGMGHKAAYSAARVVQLVAMIELLESDLPMHAASSTHNA
jgi:hypothetical protein